MTFDPRTPFDLPLLPPALDFRHEKFIDIMLTTRTELGELNGYSHSLPNPMILLSPNIIKESVASSNIENINTTVEEVLQMQLFPESERGMADKEVLRYSEAVYWGFNQLKKLPISTRLVLGIHKQLLPGAKHAYRTTQNAISNAGTGEILYTPPPAQNISKLMGDWEKFIHAEDGIDPLLKSTIAHYQFEAIHPFDDGNGRTGRILIVLYLIEQKLLALPTLFMSGYINKHRNEYYRRLREVSSHGKWNEFIIYMLEGFHAQAKETKHALLQLIAMLERAKEVIKTKHRKFYSADLVEALFAYPIITPVNLGKRLDVNYRTASRYLAALAKSGILREHYVGKYHLFINRPLLDLLKR
ncbi:MAG TPA: Fic family protein [Bacteroidota bacterium]|jgi:Fic family protein|nr:Fic family protein [Bacteroidota bacterium]